MGGGLGGVSFCPLLASVDNESSNVFAMANARVVAVAESTATLERHVSMSRSRTRKLNG